MRVNPNVCAGWDDFHDDEVQFNKFNKNVHNQTDCIKARDFYKYLDPLN